MNRLTPRSTLFPYTTLFRSRLRSRDLASAQDHDRREGQGDLGLQGVGEAEVTLPLDRKSTRLNSSHLGSSYAVFCLTKQMACGGRLHGQRVSQMKNGMKSTM